jgi:hypothetical protein
MDFQEKLAEIVAKESAALTPGDIEFLRARRSYLTPEQLETYKAQLSESEDQEEKNLEAMTRSELEEVAISLGLDPAEFSTKSKLIAAIEAKQAEQQ